MIIDPSPPLSGVIYGNFSVVSDSLCMYVQYVCIMNMTVISLEVEMLKHFCRWKCLMMIHLQ